MLGSKGQGVTGRGSASLRILGLLRTNDEEPLPLLVFIYAADVHSTECTLV